MSKPILVTGGNSGIGLALCKQLVAEHGCRVFLGSRDRQRGEKAVAAVREATNTVERARSNFGVGSVELVVIDVASDESVEAARADLKALLSRDQLYAIVNNAGTGLQHNVDAKTVVDTNLYGTKRVCEAFVPMLDAADGRIVNVGSGAGPSYVSRCPPPVQARLCCGSLTWEEIEAQLTRSADGKSGLGSTADGMGGYGLSKALVMCYTELLARTHPNLTISCITPGFIDTAIVRGYNATKPPEEGTVSLRHCLFSKLKGSGWYYGSDAVRSPLHFMRNPGEPEYDGVPPQ